MQRNTILLTTLWLALYFTVSGCSSSNRNELDSDNYRSASARVSALEKQIASPTSFTDAEFELFNVNGFSNSRTLVPGGSSWDYKLVIKLPTTDIPQWTEGMVSMVTLDQNLSWTQEIIKERVDNWKTLSQPEYFKRAETDVILIVYRKEGILFKRVTDL